MITQTAASASGDALVTEITGTTISMPVFPVQPVPRPLFPILLLLGLEKKRLLMRERRKKSSSHRLLESSVSTRTRRYDIMAKLAVSISWVYRNGLTREMKVVYGANFLF
jgi:hypothetical protein